MNWIKASFVHEQIQELILRRCQCTRAFGRSLEDNHGVTVSNSSSGEFVPVPLPERRASDLNVRSARLTLQWRHSQKANILWSDSSSTYTEMKDKYSIRSRRLNKQRIKCGEE